MMKILKNEKGFTLVEAILSMVVLSIGLWGGIAMFHNATVSSLTNDKQVVASQLASEKLETVIGDKFFSGYAGVDEDDYPSEQLQSPYNGFTRSVVVNEVDPTDMTTVSAGSGYKRVDVVVQWGVEAYEQITVSTVLSDYPGS